jgi:hypothetical protein
MERVLSRMEFCSDTTYSPLSIEFLCVILMKFAVCYPSYHYRLKVNLPLHKWCMHLHVHLQISSRLPLHCDNIARFVHHFFKFSFPSLPAFVHISFVHTHVSSYFISP